MMVDESLKDADVDEEGGEDEGEWEVEREVRLSEDGGGEKE